MAFSSLDICFISRISRGEETGRRRNAAEGHADANRHGRRAQEARRRDRGRIGPLHRGLGTQTAAGGVRPGGARGDARRRTAKRRRPGERRVRRRGRGGDPAGGHLQARGGTPGGSIRGGVSARSGSTGRGAYPASRASLASLRRAEHSFGEKLPLESKLSLTENNSLELVDLRSSISILEAMTSRCIWPRILTVGRP